jgi:hypothetical protein
MTTVPGSETDNRKCVRYPLGARAVFSWEGPAQNRLRSEGLTRDVSLAGAFVFTLTCPPAGTAVQVELFLPPMHGAVPTALLRGEARVLRVERPPTREEQSGFAVSSDDFWSLKGRELEPGRVIE